MDAGHHIFTFGSLGQIVYKAFSTADPDRHASWEDIEYNILDGVALWSDSYTIKLFLDM